MSDGPAAVALCQTRRVCSDRPRGRTWSVILCADWSKKPGKREVYAASPQTRRVWRVDPPAGGWDVAAVIRAAQRIRGGRRSPSSPRAAADRFWDGCCTVVARTPSSHAGTSRSGLSNGLSSAFPRAKGVWRRSTPGCEAREWSRCERSSGSRTRSRSSSPPAFRARSAARRSTSGARSFSFETTLRSGPSTAPWVSFVTADGRWWRRSTREWRTRWL